jgi:hypothetical protein
MNRFIFTILTVAQLLISIHSDIPDKGPNGYYDFYDEAFRPIVIGHEVHGIMDDNIKKSLGPSVVNLAASETVKYYYYGNLLNTFEKRIYTEVWKLCQKPYSFTTGDFIDVSQYKVLKSKLDGSMKKGVYALIFDYTEFWWIGGGFSYQFYTDNDYIRSIQITLKDHGYTANYITKYHDKLLSTAKTIADNAKKESTLYKRIKYIHDYLVKNTDYGKPRNDFAHQTTYGALIDKVCVCEGYAKTFAYISKLVGIEAIVIHGNTVNGSHAWNYVKIDNTWYLVDVTFDDTGTTDVFFLIGWGDKYYKENYRERNAIAEGLKYPTLSETNYKRPNLA